MYTAGNRSRMGSDIQKRGHRPDLNPGHTHQGQSHEAQPSNPECTAICAAWQIVDVVCGTSILTGLISKMSPSPLYDVSMSLKVCQVILSIYFKEARKP